MSLLDLKIGEHAIINSINVDGLIRRRLMDMGFIVGSTIMKTHTSMFNDPSVYLIKNTNIALRNNEASKIMVTQNTNDSSS